VACSSVGLRVGVEDPERDHRGQLRAGVVVLVVGSSLGWLFADRRAVCAGDAGAGGDVGR